MELAYPSYNSTSKSLTRIKNEGEVSDVLNTFKKYGMGTKYIDPKTDRECLLSDKIRRALVVPQDKPIGVALINMQTCGTGLMSNPVGGGGGKKKGGKVGGRRKSSMVALKKLKKKAAKKK